MTNQKPLQLEIEIEKIARSMMTRNTKIGKDIISYMRKYFTVEDLAGLMLISIERIIWFDTDSVFWTLEYLIPVDVLEEMKKITTFALYQRLIYQKLVPGQDFSIDANGRVLVNNTQTPAMCL